MPRIRSVHPGLFTDDAFMQLSMAARVLFIGLLCESDDQGIFKVRPPTLKAHVLPCDQEDICELLRELEDLNFLRRYDVDGVAYACIRNFRQWQRPKKPNAIHPLPDALRGYVKLPLVDEEAPENRFETGSEKASQREEGLGGRKEGGDQRLSESGHDLRTAIPAARRTIGKTARDLAKAEGLVDGDV